MRKYFMLEINLTESSSRKTDITDIFAEYIGGTGVASKLMYDENNNCNPYDPDASVYFAIGPFSNIFPVATKTVALFRSPLTGNLGESHAGGRMALALYGAGIHVLKITGKSEYPCFITIENDEVQFRRANSLKGMSALATERVLRDSIKSSHKRSILRIGPAGERKSSIACAVVDGSRHFGRLGLGGVLGSKNLKAIVISGNNYLEVPDKSHFNKFYKSLYDKVVKSPLMRKYHDLGTAMNVMPLSEINGLPTRNFSQGYFENAAKIGGEAFAEKHLAQQTACAHCQVGCIHMGTLREEFDSQEHMYKMNKVSYDYELIYACGSNLSIESTDQILKILLFIEKQGWDAMSMGVVMAWATEAYQKGIIDDNLTDGLVLNFGDGETYMKVMANIRDGKNEFYRDLEMGARHCAEKYGGEDIAIVFGGNEAPGYMTGLYSFLGYATGIRHSHLDSGGYSLDQKAPKGEAVSQKLTKSLYDDAVWRMVLNSLVICLFARNVYDTATIIEGLSVMEKTDYTEEDLLRKAKKIHAIKYRIKERFGFDVLESLLPEKLTHVQTTNGKVSKKDFSEQLEYFASLLKDDYDEFPDITI